MVWGFEMRGGRNERRLGWIASTPDSRAGYYFLFLHLHEARGGNHVLEFLTVLPDVADG